MGTLICKAENKTKTKHPKGLQTPAPIPEHKCQYFHSPKLLKIVIISWLRLSKTFKQTPDDLIQMIIAFSLKPIYEKPPEKDYHLLSKFLLVGDSGVGKSAFLSRYVDDTFSDAYIGTIGIDFAIKTIVYKGLRIK